MWYRSRGEVTITINQALAAANTFLASSKNTTASGALRILAEAYKNLFDGLNNGGIFVLVSTAPSF